MPSTATHAYFIMDIYDKLPIERKIFLKDDKELLKVSAQSMDPLNFYFSKNFKKNKKVRSFAEYFHTHKTGEFLIPARFLWFRFDSGIGDDTEIDMPADILLTIPLYIASICLQIDNE